MAQVKTARGRRFAVAAGEQSAAQVAGEMVANGGNIVDAAIAGAAVLAVKLPYACGLGGDLFLLYWRAADRTCHGLNGSGLSPASVPAAASLPERGIRSVSVPGMVAGWCDLAARFGTKPLTDIFAPAIRLARDGFPAHAGLIHNARAQQSLLQSDPEAARLFLSPDGHIPESEALIRQTDLAATLEAIANEGADAFYRGSVAAAIAACSAAAGGFLDAGDLERHRSLWCDPLQTSYRGRTVFAVPPNGPGILLQLHLAAIEQEGGLVDGAADIRLWRDAQRAAGDLVRDPRDAEMPARALLRDIETGAVRLADAAGATSATGMPGGSHTSTLAIMDAEGNAISLVQSVASPFGSGVVVPGTGVLLNNRMQGFWSPDGGDVSLASGRIPVSPATRPPHSLCPALVCKDDAVDMALGTPGHLGQTATVAQVIQQIYGRGVGLAPAIEAPRWTLSYDGAVIYEAGFADEAMRADLARLGATEVRSGDLRFGSVKAVSRDGDELVAAADFRRIADVAAG